MHTPTLRVIKILNLIVSNNNIMTLSDISKYSGIPKGTLHPICKTLVESGFMYLDTQKGTY